MIPGRSCCCSGGAGIATRLSPSIGRPAVSRAGSITVGGRGSTMGMAHGEHGSLVPRLPPRARAAELAHPHPLHRLAGACPLVAGGMPARRSPFLGMHRGDGAHSLLAAPPRPMMGPLPATVSGRCRCELRRLPATSALSPGFAESNARVGLNHRWRRRDTGSGGIATCASMRRRRTGTGRGFPSGCWAPDPFAPMPHAMEPGDVETRRSALPARRGRECQVAGRPLEGWPERHLGRNRFPHPLLGGIAARALASCTDDHGSPLVAAAQRRLARAPTPGPAEGPVTRRREGCAPPM